MTPDPLQHTPVLPRLRPCRERECRRVALADGLLDTPRPGVAPNAHTVRAVMAWTRWITGTRRVPSDPRLDTRLSSCWRCGTWLYRPLTLSCRTPVRSLLFLASATGLTRSDRGVRSASPAGHPYVRDGCTTSIYRGQALGYASYAYRARGIGNRCTCQMCGGVRSSGCALRMRRACHRFKPPVVLLYCHETWLVRRCPCALYAYND